MSSKTYTLPNGKKAVFEYDHDGIGKVTIEAMDMLMGLITDGRKRGKWIDLDDQWGFEGTFKCSACGELWSLIDGTPQDNGMNFCPNCGARMKGADDDINNV